MASRDECSAGGSHTFNTEHDDNIGTSEIINVLACDKCSKVFERRTHASTGQYKFESCQADTCDESNDGHIWEFDENHYNNNSIFVYDDCTRCSGTRSVEFKRTRTECIDANGNML